MISNISQCLDIVLRLEGGYVDNPHDPGGATQYGITQRVYDTYNKLRNWQKLPVKQISIVQAKEIYTLQYWGPVKGDLLPTGLDLLVFDFSVNSGPIRAIEFLQRELDVTADGHFGIVTSQAVQQIKDVKRFIRDLTTARLRYYQTLANWRYFGKGWKNRITTVETLALEMVQ